MLLALFLPCFSGTSHIDAISQTTCINQPIVFFRAAIGFFCSAEVVLTTCISSSVRQHKMFEKVYMLDVHVGPIDLNLFINFHVDQNSSKVIGTKWNDTALVLRS